MIELAPRFIVERHRTGKREGRFAGAGVFVDLVGFTSMTESLMEHGSPGAEQVSAVINKVFEPAVQATYAHGGWVAKYAGDAFLALFPSGASDPTGAANVITEGCAGRQELETPYGSFPIAARVGVGTGTIRWGIIPSEGRSLFFFAGTAVERAIAAQEHATPGSWKAIPGERAVQWRPPRHKLRRGPETAVRPHHMAGLVPREVIELGVGGEFRDIACMFLGFRGCAHPVDWRDPQGLEEVMRVVDMEVGRHGGYVSELDFGDKGNVVVVYFGAPRGLERPLLHAVGCAVSVREALGRKAEVRIGVTFGRVYAGLVGSTFRAEYKAVGRTVNLAARLMERAGWGTILLDEASADSLEGYGMEGCGEAELKGIPVPVRLCAVTGKSRGTVRAEGAMVGREDAVARVKEQLKEVEAARRARIVYIEGSPGIGKSRLVKAVREACGERTTWWSLPCDGILRESLNPFVRWASEYFGCVTGRTVEDHRRSFDAAYDRLVACAEGQTRRELIRTRSVLGALVGLRWENSLYEQLDAKDRFANLALGLTHVVKAASSRGVVVMEVEDCHWIDVDSIELLRRIMRGLRHRPVLVLATCRPRDDGASSRLYLEGLPSVAIRLEALDREACLRLVHAQLERNPSRQLVEFLWAKSEGNPFYLEQLLLLLKACGALQQVGNAVTLGFEPKDLPGTVSALIMARVDRVSPSLQRAAKVASVIGREFTVAVLAKMLGLGRIERLLVEGQRHQLWKEEAEGHYVFTHALIRDALYETQLTAVRAELHLQVGKAIEAVYGGHLESHYGALAHHFDVGGDAAKARIYLEKAADAAERAYRNDDALRFLGRLASYASSPAEAAEIALRRGRVLNRLGRLDEARRLLEEGIATADHAGEQTRRVRLEIARGHVLIEQGHKDDARALFERTLRWGRDHGDATSCGISLSALGRIHRMGGDLDHAAACYREAIRLSLKAGDRRQAMYALGNLAAIYYTRGDMRRAGRCYRRCLEVSRQLDDRYALCRSISMLGHVYLWTGHYTAAEECFREHLAAAQQIGEQMMMAAAAENMGLLYERAGEWQKALLSFARKARLAKEMGARPSMAIAYAEMARICLNSGRYRQGLALSDRAVAIARELRMRDFLARFLGDRVYALVRRAQQMPIDDLDQIEGLCREALGLAADLNMPNAMFLPLLALQHISALRGASDAAVAELHRMAERSTDETELAQIADAIARITRKPDDIREAFRRYWALYQHNPIHSFLTAMRDLAAIAGQDGEDLLASLPQAGQRASDTEPA